MSAFIFSVPASFAKLGKQCLFVLLGLMALLPYRYAAADLMIYPTRIVFERNQRAAQVDLVNRGTETATYRIVFRQKRMDETGGFADIDAPAAGERFADSLIRYSPRQVTLDLGAGQTVRLMVRKPADLEPSEYRSHLVFERLPDATERGVEALDGPAAGTGIGVKLTALVGVSIPVIVRHGETTANVTLSNLELQKSSRNEAVLSLHLQRSGNRSVYGDLAAYFIPDGGAERLIGQVRGVAVYTPNNLRRVRLALRPEAAAALGRGTVRVIYRERPEEGEKPLAEAEIRLH